MHDILRIHILSQRFGFSLKNTVSALVQHLKGNAGIAGSKQCGPLRRTGKISQLIYQDLMPLRDLGLMIIIFVRGKIHQGHIVKGDHGPCRKASPGGILTVSSEMEGPLRHLHGLVGGKGQIHPFRLTGTDTDGIPGSIQIPAVTHVVPQLNVTLHISDLRIVLSCV